MKAKISVILLLASIAIGFSSCNTDSDYEQPIELTGTIQSSGLYGDIIKVDQEGWGKCYCTNSLPSSVTWNYNDRVHFFCYKREKPEGASATYDTYIEIIDAAKISIEDIKFVERGDSEADTLGNEYFYEQGYYATSIWISDNYLTIQPLVPINASESSSKHWISVAVYDNESYQNAADEVVFELKHKSNRGENYINNHAAYTLISYHLDDLIHNMGDKDSITLVFKYPVVDSYDSRNPEIRTDKRTLKNTNKTSATTQKNAPKLPKNSKYNALLN